VGAELDSRAKWALDGAGHGDSGLLITSDTSDNALLGVIMGMSIR
jgi:hypothetical protein